MLIVQLCNPSNEGHGRHRIHGPGEELSRFPGVTVIDCEAIHRDSEWLCEHADVLILHVVNADLLPLIQERRKAGRITTFEACDDYFDVQAWNSNVSHWLDRTLHDQFWQIVTAVDAVQTSTNTLAERWRSKARRVIVFDNGLEQIPPLRAKPDRPWTVGWAGSVTHLADWFLIAPVLERWVLAHKGRRLAVMSDPRAKDLIHLSADRYSFQSTGTWEEYSRFLQTIDIGVVPLLGSPFNKGRTDLKFLEYASHGVVGIYANVYPYRESIQHPETGYLYNDDGDIGKFLDELTGDVKLYNQIREQAYQSIKSRTREAIARKKYDFYQNLLGREPVEISLPQSIYLSSDWVGRYQRRLAGEPEQQLNKLQGDESTEQNLQSLRGLIQRWRDWVLPKKLLGRMLNDLGRSEEARSLTRQLIDQQPNIPSFWVELGRANLYLQDYESAKYAAERALVLNPSHPSAWAILSRVAEKLVSARSSVIRNADHQPCNIITALTALSFMPHSQRIGKLGSLLPLAQNETMPAERVYMATAFSQVIGDIIDPHSVDEQEIEIVRRATEIFPESSGLADTYGRILYAQGRVQEASVQFATAEFLARVAETYRLEEQRVKVRRSTWQIGEYVQTWSRPNLEIS